MFQIYYIGNKGEIDLCGEFFDTVAEAEERIDYLDEEEDWASHGVFLMVKEVK
jgi:hypothetical protein